MNDDGLRAELEARTLAQLRVLAKRLKIAYSGKRRHDLIEDLLRAKDHDRIKLMLGPLRLRANPGERELVIALLESWTLKRRAVVFLSGFGAIWLLLEPVFAFTAGAGILSSVGWLGYVLMLVMSSVITGFAEFSHRKHRVGTPEFVSFFIVFPKSGHRLLVKAPMDMQIESFLRVFVTRLGSLLPTECAAIHLYTHNLMISTERGFRPVDSSLTLREAGIGDGTICRLRAYIRVEYTLPLLEIEYSWQPVRLELARADGLVLLDENDAVGYEEAKAMGLLTESAIARVERFLHHHGGEVFVGICPEEEIADVPALARRGEVP
jgi:hypothetical protein